MSAKSNLLKKKTITVTTSRSKCPCCVNGVVTHGLVQASQFKNIKASGSFAIQDDCNVCAGTGLIKSPIRKVLKRDRRLPVVI
jgi:hypothetical protein